jgi:hypothetical protein
MTAVTVRAPGEPGGRGLRRAAGCGVPGLVVSVRHSGGWAITHVRSGCAVAYFPDADPELVLAAARDIAPLADWTRPGPGLAADAGLEAAVKAALYPLGAVFAGQQGDPSDLEGARS